MGGIHMCVCVWVGGWVVFICVWDGGWACVRVCVRVFCRFAARIELVFLYSKASTVMQYYNCILNLTISYFMFCMRKDRF